MVKKSVDKIISDIKSVKIQGADNIAVAGIEAYLQEPTKEVMKKILDARPTEPLLQNSLKKISKSKDKKKTGQKLIKYIHSARNKVAKAGAKLIKNGDVVFTHCHSGNVLAILYEAKKQKKKFTVHTLEVEPLLQGRMTARDLARKRIKVSIFPDLAARQAMKGANILLFGVDAFTVRGLANKTGTSLLCDIAQHHRVPRYSCGNSVKLTRRLKIEKRKGKEVWDKRNKNITVENPAFDFVKKELLTGVISEFGVLTHKQFIKKAKKNLASM